MPRLKMLLFSATLLCSGCASWFKPDVTAASCPPSPPVPLAVSGFATPAKNLIEDSGRLLEDFTSELSQTLKKGNGLSM